MSTTISLARGLPLTLDAVTEVLGFLGRRGQGKSYAAQKLAELFHEAGAQFIALDPVGIWWGLRLAADGKAPGISLPVFGGLHGDVPLGPGDGRLIADLITDQHISAILDVSQFESDKARNRFVHDFGERFFFRRKQAPGAVHVFIEEAQEVIPQNPMGDGEKDTLHVLQRMAKLGRNYGIGVSLISQRPQEVHKKVLNLSELLLVFQLTGPHERKAVETWIEDKGIDEDINQELPRLKQGSPHAWSPAWLKVSKVVHVNKKWTFDASSTPQVGRAAKVRTLAPIDIEKIRKDMATTIERAKQEDPRELRRTLAERDRELRTLKQQSPHQRRETVVKEKVVHHDRPVLGERALARVEKAARLVADALQPVQAAFAAFLKAPSVKPVRVPRSTEPPHVTAKIDKIDRRRKVTTIDTPPIFDGRLGRAERAALTVLAQFPEGCIAGKLALLAGYTWSGGFRNRLSTLRTAGYMEGENTGTMRITEAGSNALGDYNPLPAPGPELFDYWHRHRRFGQAERAALQALRDHPDGLVGPELAEASGYSWSGGFRNRLSTLRTAGTIVGRNNERIHLAEDLR